MAAIGTGETLGIRSDSSWNNPEPEIVLVINADAKIVGVTLGNDVNLRDIEGRSALLLGKAKDNNASCVIGPFIRLFNETYSLDDVRVAELTVEVLGTEGFTMKGRKHFDQDQPRCRRFGCPDYWKASPISGWIDALYRHLICSHYGP